MRKEYQHYGGKVRETIRSGLPEQQKRQSVVLALQKPAISHLESEIRRRELKLPREDRQDLEQEMLLEVVRLVGRGAIKNSSIQAISSKLSFYAKSVIKRFLKQRRRIKAEKALFMELKKGTKREKIDKERFLEQIGVEGDEVRYALEKLDPRERQIIIWRFDLDDTGKTPTLREVGKRLGIDNAWVRQLEARAIKKMLLALKELALERAEKRKR